MFGQNSRQLIYRGLVAGAADAIASNLRFANHAPLVFSYKKTKIYCELGIAFRFFPKIEPRAYVEDAPLYKMECGIIWLLTFISAFDTDTKARAPFNNP